MQLATLCCCCLRCVCSCCVFLCDAVCWWFVRQPLFTGPCLASVQTCTLELLRTQWTCVTHDDVSVKFIRSQHLSSPFPQAVLAFALNKGRIYLWPEELTKHCIWTYLKSHLETLLKFDRHGLMHSVSSLSNFWHLRPQDDKANPWTESKKSIVNCPGQQSRNYEQLIWNSKTTRFVTNFWGWNGVFCCREAIALNWNTIFTARITFTKISDCSFLDVKRLLVIVLQQLEPVKKAYRYTMTHHRWFLSQVLLEACEFMQTQWGRTEAG